MAKGISVVDVFIPKSKRKDTLFKKGLSVVDRPVRIAGIMEACGGGMGKLITLVDLSKKQPASIRGHPTTVKTKSNFLV